MPSKKITDNNVIQKETKKKRKVEDANINTKENKTTKTRSKKEKEDNIIKEEIKIKKPRNKTKDTTEKSKEIDIKEDKIEVIDNEKNTNSSAFSSTNKLTYILSLLVLVICLFLCGYIIVDKTSKNTYQLQIIDEQCFDENDKLILPHKYYLADDGMIYELDDKIIKSCGAIFPIITSEEEYNNQIDMIKANYDNIEEFVVNGDTYTKVPLDGFEYYFNYKDGLMLQVVTIDSNNNEFAQILIKGIRR